jgi:hypothetical protein
MVQQFLSAGITVEIDVRKRVAVSREEFPNTKRVRRVSRTKDHHIGEAFRKYFDAPEDERAHENVAQFSISLHQPEQNRTIDFNDFACFGRPQPAENAASEKDADLARELAGLENRDRPFGSAGMLDEFQLAAGYQEDASILLAGLDEKLTGCDLPNVSV